METEPGCLLGEKQESQSLLLRRTWRMCSGRELIPTRLVAKGEPGRYYIFPGGLRQLLVPVWVQRYLGTV